jgi:hypothetical protein
MNNDFKNVFITFGLIAMVFMYGTFLNKENVQAEYLESVLQAHKEELTTLQQNQQDREAELQKQLLIQRQLTQAAAQRILIKKQDNVQAVVPNVTAPVVIQPQVIVPPVLVNTPVVSKPKPVVVRPSRQSRAS